MKKTLIGLVTTLTLATASMAFALATDDNGYYVSSNNNISSKSLLPATNITVLNYSDESIYLVIPNSTINYEIASGNSRSISRAGYYGDTELILQDWNRFTFFDRYICRRMIATVDGRPGSYRISLDSKYC